MQLSHESYRTRWLVLVAAWTLATFAILGQATLVRDYLAVVNELGLRGAPAASTPLKQMYPAFAADAQTWVRHALALIEGHDIQLRFTTIDNAPDGREVHWNSAWAWAIAGAGWVNHLFTGQTIASSVEQATVWLTPCALILLIVVLSSWATRRAGVITGVVVVAAMTCHDRIFEGFFPTYVDHHGLLTVSVFGMMLGAVFMGGGWWKQTDNRAWSLFPDSPETARNSAAFSALSGAFGLWVSAASVIPPIILVGAAGLLAVFVQGRTAREQGAIFDPGVWRIWGRIGATASLLFYLFEYFPHHLGIRLEANHPIHALAWLGGGELIAQIAERWLAAREDRWRNWQQLIWPVLAVLAVPATIAIGGAKVFVVMDPFMASLHKDYIQEFLPLWKTLRGFDSKGTFQIMAVDNLPLIAGIATLSYRGRENPIVLWFATFAAGFFNVMAWWQSRWLLNASGVQVCLLVVLLACWTASYRPLVRWLAALILVGTLFVPGGVMRFVNARKDVAARRVAPKDAYGALFRDVAAVLRASQPEGDIVLLSSPNGSTAIGYYGRFKTLGTLYWENHAGLKAAAAILGAQSEAEAASLIRARRVTHIAIVSDENFIAQYYQLLHPRATAAEVSKCFGLRLLVDRQVPQWLEMIPYKAPDDLASLNIGIMLFKVNFNQTLAEAMYHVALAQIAMGAIDDADRTLDNLLKQAPQLFQPWMRKGELLLARHDWAGAADHMLKGIALAPEAGRPALYADAAGAFYRQQQPAVAIRIYRVALAERRTPDLACYLAWVLASSKDDSIRNGKEALELAQEAIKADATSPTYLNTLAAALAENGRFAEAVDAADRALANAKLRNDAAAAQVSEQRMAVFRTGKPVRE